jgi:replicative superfamily II helicase
MGLNLNIQRVIFSTIEKSFKGRREKLDGYAIRQIGGRAGRFKEDGKITAFKI